MIRKTAKGLWTFVKKYRKILIAIAIVYAIWFFGLGIIGGFMAAKGGLSSFPDIQKTDKILILSPHIDDEVLGTAGIIQQAISIGAQVKVVYMTNGDGSLASIIPQDKTLATDPNDFIQLGEERMKEGMAASQVLGLTNDNLVFLGYPDQGLTPMLTTNYSKPYISQDTQFNYNPYQGTFESKQAYTGENVVNDLAKIINDYQPTMVFTTHLRDQHPDHSATYQYLTRVIANQVIKPNVYAFVVHYTFFPPNKKLQENRYLYPPKKLFTKEGWYSYNLQGDEETKKLEAIDKNVSQVNALGYTGTYRGFMESFVKRNEIFELMN